ncbi:MAG TPA: tetratricopeptide repeat protein [Rhizomicrobium sp.]
MSYLPLLVPLALEIACIVHAVRNGRVFPWVYIIIFLPLVGCIAYFAVEIVPPLLSGKTARALGSNARHLADPHRGLREKRRNVEMVGSVDARRALAEEYIRRGAYTEAASLYRTALEGQFRNDPALLLGLARALFLAGDGAGAQASLDALQAADAGFVSPDARLLYARALELQGKFDEARDAYAKLVRQFPGEEARCRYAMLLEKSDSPDSARQLYAEILNSLDGAPRHYRNAQRQWGNAARTALKRLNAAGQP